jgi:hypothetical protein
VDALCAGAGCARVAFSHPWNTMQTPGIPDRRYYPRKGLGFWVEAKAPDGRQSTDQAAFEAHCQRCGDPYLLGGPREVLAYLVAEGHWPLPPGTALEALLRAHGEPYRRRPPVPSRPPRRRGKRGLITRAVGPILSPSKRDPAGTAGPLKGRAR